MRSSEINHTLGVLGAQHHALVHADAAAASGITRQQLHLRVQSGVLERLDENIYRFNGAPTTWRQRILAACWGQGTDALASHRAAALLWGLDRATAAPVEVIAPRWKRRPRKVGIKLHEATDLTAVDRAEVDGIPCTSAVRTLLDLPAVVHSRRADELLEDALRQRLCNIEQVADRFVQVARRGRPGTTVMRELLGKRTGTTVPTMSEFERIVSEMAVGAGLPAPDRQVRVGLRSTAVYIDLAWPEVMLGVECDGLFVHADSVRLPWDDDRQNKLQLAGWLILRFTWEQARSAPETVVDQLLAGYHRPGTTDRVLA